jgi:hypothetical protein
MARNKKFSEFRTAENAVSPITTSGALTGVKINGTGKDRIAFIFSFGVPLANAALSSGCGIWKAATSGATYERAGASFGELTTGAMSNMTAVLDCRVDRAKPWMQVSGMMNTSNIPLAVIAVATSIDSLPPTSLSNTITAND